MVTAVGDELALAHPLGVAGAASAAVLIGGPLLFLLGTALSVFSIWGKVAWPRVIGVAILGTVFLIGRGWSPLALTMASTVVLVATGLWESFAPRGRRA